MNRDFSQEFALRIEINERSQIVRAWVITQTVKRFLIISPVKSKIYKCKNCSFWACVLNKREHYGNTGCGVFKRGIQNVKYFCLRINISKGNYWILSFGLMASCQNGNSLSEYLNFDIHMYIPALSSTSSREFVFSHTNLHMARITMFRR